MGTRMLFAKWRPIVYAATRLSSLNGSLFCSCSPWHARDRQRATPWEAYINAWSKWCCRVRVIETHACGAAA